MDERNTKTQNTSGKDATTAARSANGTERPAGAPTPRDRVAGGTRGGAEGERRPATPTPTPRVIKAAATGPETTSRALHDTVMDERDDVLSVINELEDHLDRYEELRLRSEREIGQLNERVQAATQKSQELEWHGASLQTRLDALEHVRDENKLLQEEIAEANRRNTQLVEQVASGEQEAHRLRGELKMQQKDLEELWATRKERDGLRSDLKLTRSRLNESEQALQAAREECGALRGQLQETQSVLDETRAARQQMESTLHDSEDRVRQLARVQEAMEEKLQAGRVERKTLQARIAQLEREQQRIIDQRQFFECELNSARAAHRTTEAALTSVKKAFGEVRAALAEAKSRSVRRAGDTGRGVIAMRSIDVDIESPAIRALRGLETTGDSVEAPDATALADITERYTSDAATD